MDKNEVYVTTDLQDERLWHRELSLATLHWITAAPDESKQYRVRTRYRAPLVNCHIKVGGKKASVKLDEEVRAVTPGQSAVIYDGDLVLGGGIVTGADQDSDDRAGSP